MGELPECIPPDTLCDYEGHKHLLRDCPNWIPMPDNLADAKALLALGGLTINHEYQGETK